ncbi:Signal transduction histidine kinase [Prevotella sp. khp1]|jgi:signal transduction histidine kinase|uniref:sensor histidine kinase n=1 Tax=Prevotellaceae TaxID=171552 RepID=UPI00087EF7A0|nr:MULTISPECIES: HAMP domain-containing sensor histidine kinase [Prevotellaceae]QVJ80196.1 HAMP domain-containing histidine kinase [Xylanibacter ruminicola]SDQ69509.1 Signal transduction histidine kinase [Prevotella sp. khp1]
MVTLCIIIGVVLVVLVIAIVHHQHKLRLRAHLMKEAIRNQDFSFRLPTNNLLPGERAMQEALNELGENIRQQMNKNEVESWERLTRVLTHEMMNATAPITSISQSLLSRPDVKGTLLEDGIKAIYDTSRHLSDFVTNYRKMSELEKPVLSEVPLRPMLDELCKTYQQLAWTIDVPADTILKADKGMLRQILMNLIKNAIEAEATKIIIELTNQPSPNTQHPSPITLLIGNDGSPIPAENRQSLFVPFFTTKRTGSGIGLSLSRRMMIQQGGMLDLAEKNLPGCHVTFVLSSI